MPNIVISQILVQLITLVDALILYVTKSIDRHRWVFAGERFNERIFSSIASRQSSEESVNVVNWSHIDGLFDVVLTIGKQTLIETDEQVGQIDGFRLLSAPERRFVNTVSGWSRSYSYSLFIVFSLIPHRSTISGSCFSLALKYVLSDSRHPLDHQSPRLAIESQPDLYSVIPTDPTLEIDQATRDQSSTAVRKRFSFNQKDSKIESSAGQRYLRAMQARICPAWLKWMCLHSAFSSRCFVWATRCIESINRWRLR